MVFGCGSPELELHPVTGVVVLKDGRPVEGAIVEFSAAGGSGARGLTGPGGRFELSTGEGKGAMAGSHRVAVLQMAVADGAAAHLSAHHTTLAVHPKYASFATSGLTRQVSPGPNDFTLEVDPAAGKQGGW